MTLAIADHEDDGERSDTSADVNGRAAGEVECSHFEEPAVEHPLGARDVDE
jgi:hypothetical protein